MEKEAIYERLNGIFQKVEDGDSLEHINLLVAIEAEFHIKFDIEEVLTMKNVGEMVDTILEKLA